MKGTTVRIVLMMMWIFFPSIVFAWSSDTSINTPIVVAPNDQGGSVMVRDGAGGAFIAWEDYRDEESTDRDIYVQHLDATGAILWAVNGVVVCNAPGSQKNFKLAIDGYGGLFITWVDKRDNNNEQLFASHINSQGVSEWGANGKMVSATPNSSAYLDIISDGMGYAVLLWGDVRSGTPELYAQRLDADSVKYWGDEDTLIASSISNAFLRPHMTTDGAGGAIISWEDASRNIYAQKINSSGVFQWGDDGIVVSDSASNLDLVSDGSGGAFILFSSGSQGLVQHVSAAGTAQWDDPVIWSEPITGMERFVSDEQGGVIISWDLYNTADPNSPNNRAIYVQILASDGSLRFGEEGLHIGNKCYYSQQDRTSIVPDGSDGFIATWTNSDANFNTDIVGQRFGSEGAPVWDTDPVPISTNSYNQIKPVAVSDGEGGAIFVWIDERNGDQQDLYANRFTYDGSSSGLQTPINISPSEGAPVDVPITLNASEFIDSQGIVSHAGSQWRLHSFNTITPMIPEQDFSGDDAYFIYQLPFTFPFFGRSISSISINSNGLIELLEEGEESYITDGYMTHSEGEHIGHIDAVFAANDDLDLTSGYFRLYNAGDQVVIEWYGATYEDDGNVNAHPLHYQVTLQSDGGILWNFHQLNFSQHEGDLFSGIYPNGGIEIPLPADSDAIKANTPTAFVFNPVSRQITSAGYNWFEPQPVLYDSGETTDLLLHQLPSSVPLEDHAPYYWGVRYKGDNDEWTLWSTPTSFIPDLSVPTITSTVPADQENSVAVNAIINITFSEEMTAGSIDGSSISLSGPNGSVAGTVSYDGLIASFSPANDLAANATYTGTVTIAATDIIGKHLGAEYNWVFTTSSGADTTPPQITSRTPAADAVDVAVDIAAIRIAFNEPMQEATINAAGSILLTGPGGVLVPGNLSYDAVSNTVQIAPGSTLSYDTVYTVTVTTAVQDSAGNPLTSNQTWHFTTADTPPPPPLEDTSAPLVISHAPTLASSPVPAVIGAISATFNEVVQGVTGLSFLVSHNSVPVAGTVSFDEGAMTARFDPADDLDFSTTYSVSLTAASIRDLAGNYMEHDYTWSFSTSTDPALSGCNPELFDEDGCESFDYFTYGTGAEAGTYRCCIGGYQAEYAARRSVSFEHSPSEALVDTDYIRAKAVARVNSSEFSLHLESRRKNDNDYDSGCEVNGASKIQVTGAPPGSVIPMSMIVTGDMPWGSMILQVRDMGNYQMLGAAEGGSNRMYYSNVVDPFAPYSSDNYIQTDRNSSHIRLDFQYPVEANNGIYVWFIGGTAQYKSAGTNRVDLTARLEVSPPPGVTVRLASGQVFTGPVDSDHDGVADAEDNSPHDNTKASPETPDGSGNIAVDVSMNGGAALSQVQVLDDEDISIVQANKPSGYTFPDGLVSFQINGLQPGATALVTLEFPTPFPSGTHYYKVNDNGFYEFSGAVFSGNKVTLTVTDGGAGDRDGLANGVIVDPGGPAVMESKKGFWVMMLPAITGGR